ncbi:hypothetical protein [Dyadobacter sp. BHUBP1]|uniref:hypothetical protein n=1 Tax=Dyadobacter sp. BHUBP1 TaxID=3424178 RepID=UPI003D34D55D
MKKVCFYLFALVICCLAGCKKEKDLDPEKTLKEDLFLRSIKVAGAREVTIDTARNYIQIVLPEGYTDDIVDLQVDAAPGAELVLDPWKTLYSAGHVKYHFRAAYPENFTMVVKSSSRTKSYKVFVEQEGPLTAELTSDLDLQVGDANTAAAVAKIRLKSGVGSVPERPDLQEQIVPFLRNSSKNVNVKGSFDNGLGVIFFEDILSLMEAEGTALSIEYGEKAFSFPQKLKLKRAKVSLFVVQPDRLFRVFQTGKTIEFDGGIFLNSQKYTLKLHNDASSSEVTLPATITDLSTLKTQFPASIADGQYKVSFFENTQLITQAAIVIARDSTVKAIGQMWTGGQGIPWEEIWKTQPMAISRGQELFVNPFPAIIDASAQPFDNKKKVPDLALKLNGKITVLKATVKEDPKYADNSIRIYYGAYRIPADLLPGRYEATMVLDNKQYSLPYWSRVEIR